MSKKVISVLIMIIALSVMVNVYVNGNMLSVLNAQSAPVFQLPKGAKVVLGTYNGNEIVWDIGNNDNNGSYVLMSSKPITKMTTYDSSVPVTTTIQSGADRERYCLKTLDNKGASVLNYCPIAPVENEISTITLNPQETAVLNKSPFLPSVVDIHDGGNLGLSVNDRAYTNGESCDRGDRG